MSMDDTFDDDESLLVSPPTRQSCGDFLDESAADDSRLSVYVGNVSNDDDVLLHRLGWMARRMLVEMCVTIPQIRR